MNKPYFIAALILLFPFALNAQQLKPGFDKNEYYELMLVSARSTASQAYYDSFPKPSSFVMLYQSAAIGLDNMWDLWKNEQGTAAISIRGTTAKSESWMANFYAAMVPAIGKLVIQPGDTFNYHLADNPMAAVHVGWLLSTAYLSKEIIPKVNELYQTGTKEFYIIGHSQGGGIAYLLRAYLHNLQQTNQLPADIKFKTYCSAAPKPGNLYFAYEYETITQGGWAFNVVNAADWVPEVPISIQTVNDFNTVNPFKNAEQAISQQPIKTRIALMHVYKQLSKPTLKAQQTYEKYLGKLAADVIKNTLTTYQPPKDYYNSNNYVRTGTPIILLPDEDYFKRYPNTTNNVFTHHFHTPYLYLLQKLK